MSLDCNTGNSLIDDATKLVCLLKKLHTHKPRLISSKSNSCSWQTVKMIKVLKNPVLVEKCPDRPYYYIAMPYTFCPIFLCFNASIKLSKLIFLFTYLFLFIGAIISYFPLSMLLRNKPTL